MFYEQAVEFSMFDVENTKRCNRVDEKSREKWYTRPRLAILRNRVSIHNSYIVVLHSMLHVVVYTCTWPIICIIGIYKS